MGKSSRAIETTGTIDEFYNLVLDTPLPVSKCKNVRVIILLPDDEEIDTSDIDETQWHYAASQNPAYDFLKEDTEDIYSINDGIPFKRYE